MPCGMLVMITWSLFADLLIFMKIISKGFMECVGEFIALAFGIVFTCTWVVSYFSANDFVNDKMDEESRSRVNRQPVSKPNEENVPPPATYQM